jgi:hypothetical protein
LCFFFPGKDGNTSYPVLTGVRTFALPINGSIAKEYLGKDKFPFPGPGEVRVIYKIRPEKVSTMG